MADASALVPLVPLTYPPQSPTTKMVFNFKKLVSMATLVTALSALCTYPSPVAGSPLVARAQCAATLSTAAVSVFCF